ncbi:hypothetical protein BS47DRAFT_1401730 [Hydnum rufescens UP504]|uniref:Uncharacterized protein n=1 Tax=Hydnum rufescens UP504 TaxID=1448309 RepID=A0A9P6AEC2_9AGAM|nr:hypothetical protein BS47DRAFT_1401730 [Hydnum rufescens UP504]
MFPDSILANSAMHMNDPDTVSIIRLEHWTLRFSNTAQHYTHVHQFNEDDNKLYCYDPLPCRWDQIPDFGNNLEFNDFTRIPFPLNLKAPHWPYIVCHFDDPVLPAPTNIVFISRDNYRLNYGYVGSLVDLLIDPTLAIEIGEMLWAGQNLLVAIFVHSPTWCGQ